MTCIIGFLEKDLYGNPKKIWIGGDSLGSNGYTKSVNTNLKVFRHELFKNVIMGSTSTFRHIDLLQYSEKLFPELDWYKPGTVVDRKYMVTTFIPNLVNLFQNNICSESSERRGGNFILGAKDKLFEIQSDYSVLEPACGYTAVGSGEDVAMGSLYATTHECTLAPHRHIEIALKAAENACCGVQRPFRIISTDENDKEIVIE